MKRNGFTLIEVLISMSIFSFIAVGTGGAVSRGTSVKNRVEKEWQEIHSLRTAYRILDRDLYLAFHHLKEKKSTTFFTPKDESLWFKSFFFGKSDRLYFTSLANRRLYTNTHESELCEIGYELHPNEKHSDLMDLKRRKSTLIDDNKEKGGEFLVILEGIKSFEFQYYSKKQDRWHEDWDAGHRDFEDQFPDAVQVKYTLVKEDQTLEYQHTILVAHPNNEQPKGGQAAGGGQAGGGGKSESDGKSEDEKESEEEP